MKLRDHPAFFPSVIFMTAMLAIFLGAKHTPRAPIAMEFGWTAASYLVLPLATIVWLDMTRPTAAARVLAGMGTATILALQGSRVLYRPARLALKEHPEAYFAIAIAACILLLAAARVGRADLSRWGLGLGDWRWWGHRVGLMMLGVVGLVILGAWLFPGLREAYPDYKPARTDLSILLTYQAGLGIYMLGWEFFFRGFLLFGVARTAGPVHAILFQSIPFFIMHRNAEPAEMISSFFGAILLAMFCWRGRSFWAAPFLHWGLNFSMEIVAFFW